MTMTTARAWAGAVALALVLAAAWPSPARAADPIVVGPEITTAAPSYGLATLGNNLQSPGASTACGPDRCVVVWQGPDASYAMVIDADGVPVRKTALGFDGLLSWQSAVYAGDGTTGDLIVGAVSGGDIHLVRLASDGTAAASATLAVSSRPIYELSLGWNGSRLLVLYGVFDASQNTTVFALPVDTNLAMLGPPVEIATPSDWHRALVRSGNELVFLTSEQAWALGADGRPRIGPVALPADSNHSGLWAVSANGTPVVYAVGNQARLFKLGPNLDVTASINTQTMSGVHYMSALAWNGTHVLLAQPDDYDAKIYTRRYTVDPLAGLETITVPLAADSAVLAAGRGGEFMLFPFRLGSSAPEYGIFALPLNAGGRPRITSERLISITAYVQEQPLVVATPSGFIVTAPEGPFFAGLMPLGPDGRPVAGRPAAAGLSVDKGQRAYSIGAGPTGGTAVIGGNYGRVFGIRFDAQGAPVDPLPTPIMIPAWVRRGGITWNGTSFLWACDEWSLIVGADGRFGTPMYLSPYIDSMASAARAIGATTLVAWLDTYIPGGGGGVQLKTMRLDATGAPLDTAPNLIGSTFPWPGTGLALADDGTRSVVLFDAATRETSGALTSELRAFRLGANGRALDTSPTVLRRATGAVPEPTNLAVPALSTPTLAYDGALFWAVWREVGAAAGVWARRIGGDGVVVDPQPVKVLGEPFGGYDIASRGDGKVLLVYDRFDPTPEVQVSRVKARVMGTTGVGGTGGGGGGGGAAGAGGRGGAGGGGAGTGGRGGASGGGSGGVSGGAGGAAGGGTAGSSPGGSGGASAGGGGTAGGSGGTAATGGASGSTGGAASAGSGGASAGSGGTPDAGASDAGATPADPEGCGCAAAGSGSSGARAIAWLGFALALAVPGVRRWRGRAK